MKTLGTVTIMAILVVTLITLVATTVANADVYVRGYYRSNGTYVQPHYRSNPDGNFWNNWSTYPNVNPYTGAIGTRRTPSYSGGYSWRTPSYGTSSLSSSYSWRTPSYNTPSYSRGSSLLTPYSNSSSGSSLLYGGSSLSRDSCLLE